MTKDVCCAACFFLRFCGWPGTMRKRSRGPPAGTEERREKRRRREPRQLQRFTFAEVQEMRQDSYRTCTVTPAIPESKRFATVS